MATLYDWVRMDKLSTYGAVGRKVGRTVCVVGTSSHTIISLKINGPGFS